MRKARLFGQACASLLLIVLIGAPTVQAQITVSMPALSAPVGETVSIPVEVGNVEANPFAAWQFTVFSSSSNFVFLGQDKTGTLSDKAGWSVNCCVNNSTIVGGFASSLDAINTSGTLIYLLFRLDAVESGITLELRDWLIGGGGVQMTVNPDVPTTDFTISTDTEDEDTLPGSFLLRGNYPNPFNPTTNIQFDLPQTSEVEVQIMDILGREMLTVPAQTYAAGTGQTVAIDAESLSSGIYIYRVIARTTNDMKVASGTMTLIK